MAVFGVGGGTRLRADLHDALVATRGFDHQPALAQVVRRRFFDVDVLAGVAGENGRGRVPMIGGGDEHGVDVLVLQDASKVADLLGRAALAGFDAGGGLVLALGVGIADVGDADVFFRSQCADVARAHAARADDGDVDAIVGAEDVD